MSGEGKEEAHARRAENWEGGGDGCKLVLGVIGVWSDDSDDYMQMKLSRICR